MQKTKDDNNRKSGRVKMEDERNESMCPGGAGTQDETDVERMVETVEEAAVRAAEEAAVKAAGKTGRKSAEKIETKDRAGELLSAVPLLLGIVSIICIFVNSWVGIILAAGGAILGLSIRKQHPASRNLILAGIICSAAGIVSGVFSMILKLWVIGEVLTFFS